MGGGSAASWLRALFAWRTLDPMNLLLGVVGGMFGASVVAATGGGRIAEGPHKEKLFLKKLGNDLLKSPLRIIDSEDVKNQLCP